MTKEKVSKNKKHTKVGFYSLRIKMLITLVFAISLSVGLLVAVNVITRQYITTEYMSGEAKEKRAQEYKDDLQKYVTDNKLTCDDTADISRWAKENRYVYVLIFKDDKLLFESGKYEEPEDEKMEENKDNDDKNPSDSVENGGNGDSTGGDETPDDTENGGTSDDTGDTSGNENSPEDDNKNEPEYPSTGITVKPPTRDELIADALANGSYPIYMADEGVLLASMVDYSEYFYYDAANIGSFVIAIFIFIIIMWLYFMGISRRISKLGKEVTIVAEGDMQHPIASMGNDEITKLSMNVETMRTSMLENIQKQYSALEANKDLITAMSHDIRTPLTVLLGYLDIMKLNAPDGDMKNYIEASEATAMRLKKMSDDMFGYFLVYGGDLEVDIQECNARTLVEQMISGHVFLLREQGYNIEYDFENKEVDFLEGTIVVTDPPQLMRIVENLISNVMKYADKQKPVSVKISRETDEMTIIVSNYVSKNIDEAQKTGIGLRSCMKLANAMDIRFSTGEENDVFTSVMNIPIVPDIEYNNGEIQNEKKNGGFTEWLNSVSKRLKATFEKLCKTISSIPEKIKTKKSKK